MLRRQALSLSALLLAGPLFVQKGAVPPSSADQSAASAESLKRMRSLLQEMQTNLVYLPSGYSAMKHLFELQCDMWRLLLIQMERSGQSVAPTALPVPSAPIPRPEQRKLLALAAGGPRK